MKLSTDRIQTTHAGSLPRPPDLTRMMWDLIDEKPVDQSKLNARVVEAVAEAVKKQRDAGIDIISDGEMSKIGFSNYVMQRYNGFANRTQFIATDLGERERLVADLGSKNAMILRNHGTLAVGETVGACFLRLYFLERACEAQVLMLSAGRENLNNPPQGTPEKVEQQANPKGVAKVATTLAWPALLRKLDRIDPSYRT